MSELCEKFERIVDECRFMEDGRELINLQQVVDKAVACGLYHQMSEDDWKYIREKGYISAMHYSSALKRLRAKTLVPA